MTDEIEFKRTENEVLELDVEDTPTHRQTFLLEPPDELRELLEETGVGVFAILVFNGRDLFVHLIGSANAVPERQEMPKILRKLSQSRHLRLQDTGETLGKLVTAISSKRFTHFAFQLGIKKGSSTFNLTGEKEGPIFVGFTQPLGAGMYTKQIRTWLGSEIYRIQHQSES